MASDLLAAVATAINEACEPKEHTIEERHSLKGDLGMDRIAILQMTTELAERFGTDVPASATRGFRTVGDVVRHFRESK